MAHSSVIQSASIDFEISLVQSKSIWYFRQFFQLKWNESKSNKNWMHCRDVYAFQMKFYTVHWSATEITNRQEIKRSRDSKFLHAWKHFLNLWFQTISLEFCFFPSFDWDVFSTAHFSSDTRSILWSSALRMVSLFSLSFSPCVLFRQRMQVYLVAGKSCLKNSSWNISMAKNQRQEQKQEWKRVEIKKYKCTSIAWYSFITSEKKVLGKMQEKTHHFEAIETIYKHVI